MQVRDCCDYSLREDAGGYPLLPTSSSFAYAIFTVYTVPYDRTITLLVLGLGFVILNGGIQSFLKSELVNSRKSLSK